ncbi:MAG TPA: SemiSWEET family transporter, partial [Candidatus Polarisedimenticolaceae bacterium]|nr:SemiSWEET family transporter [Candidatus Polarisedimenticolaceae bacterium]
ILIGTLAFLLTFVIQLPQAIRVVRTCHTRDLSMTTYILVTASAALWVVYGLMIHDLAIWGANTMVLLLSAIILGYKIKFG